MPKWDANDGPNPYLRIKRSDMTIPNQNTLDRVNIDNKVPGRLQAPHSFAKGYIIQNGRRLSGQLPFQHDLAYSSR
ncbi:uncharacterized protein N7484_009330 [Penicillium longicatenatum]|uniref:uncharacterized protein n=1 Tax=Penicillium longicatenatum TaxID=1561947 RepID=UPI002546EC82|nr:uncharacterized protein N7484_009330 [Penicillium longicatenatum]KAJ5636017.1 hypothetical protein N7484_009330 [Penicillium longicatenatum]